MLSDILWGGFARAHQRLGLVLLDVLWKLIWFILTLFALYLAAAWIASDLLAISWSDTANRAVNGFVAVTLLRQFWAAHRNDVLIAAGLIAMLSMLGWLLLEAFFRRRLASSRFHILFLSNVAKYVVLGVVSLLLLPAALAGATTIAVITLIALAFLLTLFDSVIRVDAVELLGTDLFRVAALLGILMSFELMVGGSVIGLLLIGLSRASRLLDALVMLGATAAGVLLLNLLHSYLLLVRYSAITIVNKMRRNVVEV